MSVEGNPGVIASLAEQVRETATRDAVVAVRRPRTGLTTSSMTVEELSARAGQAAATLAASGVRAGDRVLLSTSEPHDFTVWFLGALGCGAIAVPLPPPSAGGRGAFVERIVGVVADCEPRCAIVSDPDAWRRRLEGAAATLPVLAARDLAGVPLALRQPDPSEPAFLQYTSGSTGVPKGVVVTHGNLAANLHAIGRRAEYSRADTIVSWLPLHHDMGLIGGLLSALYWRIPTYLLAPVEFLTRPASWLEAVSRFRGTVSLAPNFAYELLVHRVPDAQLEGTDLSSWRLAMCGAEPIDADVVRAFNRRYERLGLSPRAFYPVYGLAEATVAVTMPAAGSPVRYDAVDRRVLAAEGRAVHAVDAARAQVHVSVGRPVAGLEVTVVHPETRAPCPERHVGEVVVSGTSVTPRYWSESPGEKRDHFATGDLGYLADGELFVVDRIKDLVIIAGQNYAPSDIEAAVAGTVGLRRGHVLAFGARETGAPTDSLVVVAEVDVRHEGSLDAIREEIQSRIRTRVTLVARVVLVAPGTVQKTTSGKLRRRAYRQRWERGELMALENPLRLPGAKGLDHGGQQTS